MKPYNTERERIEKVADAWKKFADTFKDGGYERSDLMDLDEVIESNGFENEWHGDTLTICHGDIYRLRQIDEGSSETIIENINILKASERESMCKIIDAELDDVSPKKISEIIKHHGFVECEDPNDICIGEFYKVTLTVNGRLYKIAEIGEPNNTLGNEELNVVEEIVRKLDSLINSTGDDYDDIKEAIMVLDLMLDRRGRQMQGRNKFH